ncbi:hypothetical protein BGZ61DRAFT_508882 [Ilyonectria robusta]|uniref:uncharacterized protein n=1 Tax=Ilyonectria robusta TaxID=1079257 RepID=UPI001E8CC820|nr:uncharacterized protein BGZ61DRAFT_508882 [Ilyonectria robusta]KAH8672243.1 hypothetical protein BGZ61DRAFT_508882 [Ilyonectria robusta]
MPPRRACDLCYKRKIQCVIAASGDPCDWCSSHDLACTFDRVVAKNPNKRATSDVVQELSNRVEELEDALKAATTASTPSVTSPESERRASSHVSYHLTPPTATTTSEQPARDVTIPVHTAPTLTQPSQLEPRCKLSTCQLGNNWYFKGIGILSSRGREWISEGAGQRVFLDKFDIFGNPISTRPQLNPMPEQPKMLPPEFLCRRFVAIFLESKTSKVFPILDRDLLEGTISRAYDTKLPDLGSRTSAEACLWAMFAFASRARETERTGSIPGPYECASEAKRLLFVINGTVNLDSLQATLLLWAYQKMKGQCREASVALTSACRMVCDLGGHALLPGLSLLPQHIPIFDEPSRFHIRRLFWICYCVDKDASLRTGIPPLLTCDYCEVGDAGECSSQTSWYNQSRDIDLARIKESAGRQLCSPRAFKYTEGELLSHVRQLDDELEEWRLSIEPPYRPRLSVPPDSSLLVPSSMRTEDRMRIINLQLDYLFTMIYIHTTVRKCGDFERNLPDDLHSVVHSSADLSLEASRSIIRFLESAVDFWEEESVWVVSHYAPMAAMPLFVNILIHPLGSPADNDLQILASASNLTRKIPTDRLSGEEIGQIQEIGEFVMELVRLCHSAAWKAKKGEREMDLDIIHR